MNKEPVPSRCYDDEWLNSAWSRKGNEALFSEHEIRPRPRVRRALELAGILPGMDVLDIGCGRGEVVALAQSLGAHAIGLDYSTAAIGFADRVRDARRRHSAQSTGSYELVRGDAKNPPFADASFDRIMMLDIIEHLLPRELDAMLDAARRLLRPGGYVVLHTLPNRWFYEFVFPLLHCVFRKVPRDPRSPIERQVHVNEQDLIGLHKSLDAAQLRHRIWLEQHIPAQARWSEEHAHFQDNRNRFYPVFSGLIGKVLELASHTPAKLFVCNDIYGVAWAGKKPSELKIPTSLTERALLFASRSRG